MYHNLAREYTTTTGTSNCVLTGAVPGFLTWEGAGVTNSEEVKYGIITYSLTTHRPTHSEVGRGTYTTADNTLARTTVETSTNSGSKITLTGLSEVYICPLSSDFNSVFAQYAGGTITAPDATPVTIPITGTDFDDYALGTVDTGTDKITINDPGWYSIVASIGHFSNGADYNGTIFIGFETTGLANIGERRGYVTAWAVSSDDVNVIMPSFHVTTADTNYIQMIGINSSGASIDFYVNRITLIKLEDE